MCRSFQESLEPTNNMFIVFEGPHASGKTTQVERLYQYFQAKGTRARMTKEPYSKDLAHLINKHSKEELVNSPVLMYLLAADRYVHTMDISSWIKKGLCVICDRYVLSSWVYQQIQGFSLNEIRRTNRFVITPRLTFYIKLPFEERIKRVRKTHKNKDDFFLRDDNLRREQELYDALTNSWDERRYGKMVVLNGKQDLMNIHKNIADLVSKELM